MKTDRLIALIMMLLEREIISARELAERLEVSRRTIYRDVDALNCAGLPIFTHHGAMGDWMRTDWVRVTLRLDLSVMDRVIERFGAEHIVQIEDQTCIAIYPIIPNEHGYDRLLAFGTKCEVLEPAEIREGLQRYIRCILAKYQEEKA